MATKEQVKEQEEAGQDREGSAAQLEGRMAEFVDWVEGISVLELSRLVKALEERLGVTAMAPMMAAAPAAGEAAGAPAEEQTEFTVVLAEVGDQRIPVIKEVRAVTGLGLKESKDLVEGAPKPLKEKVSKEEAEEIKAKLEAVGAKIEIK